LTISERGFPSFWKDTNNVARENVRKALPCGKSIAPLTEMGKSSY